MFVSNPTDEETDAAFDFQSCFQRVGGSGTLKNSAEAKGVSGFLLALFYPQTRQLVSVRVTSSSRVSRRLRLSPVLSF